MVDDTPEKSISQELQQYVNRRIREATDSLLVLIERVKDRVDNLDDRDRRREQEIILLRGEMNGGFTQTREMQKSLHDEQMALLKQISAETFEPLKEFIAMIKTPEQREQVLNAIRQTIKKNKAREKLTEEVTKSAVHWIVPLVGGAILAGLLLLAVNTLNNRRDPQPPVAPASVNVAPQYVMPPGTELTVPGLRSNQPQHP